MERGNRRERRFQQIQSSTGVVNVGKYVSRKAHNFSRHTTLEVQRSIARLDWSDFNDEILQIGKGGFADVFRVELISEEGKPYALKRLSKMSIQNNKNNLKAFKTGAIDLALEANILERLSHPNIITLHGVKSGDLEQSINNREYFLVLDFLLETLTVRLLKWKNNRKCHTVISRTEKLLMNRVDNSAVGIARAMEYMHGKNIIFRDLKPDNIGFALDGDQVKLFDFGLARDLQQVSQSGDILGFTGTPRYMANEIGSGETYGLPVDVYSFGILLWQLITLREPFPEMAYIKHYHDWVVKEGKRPNEKLIRSQILRELCTDCWQPESALRPTFSQIRQKLEQFVEKPLHPATKFKKEVKGFLGNRKNSSRSGMTEESANSCRPAVTVETPTG